MDVLYRIAEISSTADVEITDVLSLFRLRKGKRSMTSVFEISSSSNSVSSLIGARFRMDWLPERFNSLCFKIPERGVYIFCVFIRTESRSAPEKISLSSGTLRIY